MFLFNATPRFGLVLSKCEVYYQSRGREQRALDAKGYRMAASRFLVEVDCSCGVTYQQLVWTVLDLQVDSEALTSTAGVSWMKCPTCKKNSEVDSALVVLNAIDDIIVLGHSNHRALTEARASHILQEILDTETPAPPGTFVVAERSSISTILPRIVATSDVAHEPSEGELEYEAFKTNLARVRRENVHYQALLSIIGLTSAAELHSKILEDNSYFTQEFGEYLVKHFSLMRPERDSFEEFFLERNIQLFSDIRGGVGVLEATSSYFVDFSNYLEHVIHPNLVALIGKLNSSDLEGEDRAEIYQRALLRARQLGDLRSVASLHYSRAQEQLNETPYFTVEAASSVISELSEAHQAATQSGSVKLRAHVAVDLATMLTRSPVGDRSENIESAITLYKDALSVNTRDTNPENWALIQTNMANSYLERYEGRLEDNLSEAEHLCKAALEIRRPERNETDWAYTIYQLAYTLSRKARTISDDRQASSLLRSGGAFYEKALDAFARSNVTEHAIDCHRNIASLSLEQAQRLATARKIDFVDEILPSEVFPDNRREEIREFLERAELAEINPALFGEEEAPQWAVSLNSLEDHDAQETELLEFAERSIRKAIEGSVGVGRGSMRRVHAEIAVELGRERRAIREVLAQGLIDTDGYDEPEIEAEIAIQLGQSYIETENWNDAANFYVRAIDCRNRLYSSRRSPEGQSSELGRYPKIVEFCAYALIRSGRLFDAVLVLENGRARQLSSRVMYAEPEMDRLWSFDPIMGERLDRAQRDSDSRVAAVLEEVRQYPGFEDFGLTTHPDQIARAASFAPLVYLVATPAGSASVVAHITSRGLEVALLSESSISSANLVSILARFGQGGNIEGLLKGSRGSVDDSLERTRHMLGDMFGRNLGELVRKSGITEVDLIPAGIVGSIPLSLAEVDSSGPNGRECIADIVSVSVNPSAAVSLGCRRRAEKRAELPVKFVGIADPQRENPAARLAWAEIEVERSASFYGFSSETRVGKDATVSFFQAAAPGATHLHLACHGQSDLADSMESMIILADGNVSARSAGQIDSLNCRIIVISACESAHYGFGPSLNEVVGLATSFVAAGSACVVASLWKVDDLATSLLMVKFHEYLQRDTPANALRSAQQWLREVRDSEVLRLVDRHLDRGLGRLGGAHRSTADTEGPFALPRYWAPFVILGH